MSENAELKAMLVYLNYYSRFRGKFYEDLHGINYSQDLTGLGMTVTISKDAMKELYASELRAFQLARDVKAESDLRTAWVHEHIDEPLEAKHLVAVAEGRKLDSEKKA